jgi:hypothetical protein
MGWGDFYGGRTSNLSGKAGDQGTIYNLVKQIEMEIEDPAIQSISSEPTELDAIISEDE